MIRFSLMSLQYLQMQIVLLGQISKRLLQNENFASYPYNCIHTPTNNFFYQNTLIEIGYIFQKLKFFPFALEDFQKGIFWNFLAL